MYLCIYVYIYGWRKRCWSCELSSTLHAGARTNSKRYTYLLTYISIGSINSDDKHTSISISIYLSIYRVNPRAREGVAAEVSELRVKLETARGCKDELEAVYIYTRIHLYLYLSIYLSINTHTHIHTHTTHIYMYSYVYVCMHMCYIYAYV